MEKDRKIKLLEQLKHNKRAILEFRSLYNSMCRPCKVKAFNQLKDMSFDIKLDDLCSRCKAIARVKISKVKEMLKCSR